MLRVVKRMESSSRSMLGLACFVALLATIDAVSNVSHAARKEYLTDIRHEYISVEYIYEYSLTDDETALQSHPPSDAAGMSAQPSMPRYSYDFAEAATGLRVQLTIDFFDWLGVYLNTSDTEREVDARVENTNPANNTQMARVVTGNLERLVYDGALIFHTPGEIFSFDMALGYSMVDVTYSFNNSLELSSGFNNTNDREGGFGWLGARFSLGDRWEMGVRLHQSFYDDRFEETTAAEWSVAFFVLPKAELRLTTIYDVNNEAARTDFGLRMYF